MIKILFVCHGNICRSPMAEFVMKDLVNRAGIGHQFEIASVAVSREELGKLMEQVAGTLAVEAPEGIQIKSLSCGATEWDEKQRCLRRRVSAACTAWLLALSRAEGEFLDFELRGGWKH